ncbi:MAG: type II toxin-antitoxin system YhaV family toxin [Terriglobales bacterium]
MQSYKVELTPIAQKTYEEMYADVQACITAGDLTNAKITTLRMVDDAIDNIIPHDPFSTTNALSGPLSNIFRVKKGRLRIYYAASSKEKKIVILYISQTLRKAGDVNDPYSIFTRLVMTGRFNEYFSRFGVRIPPKNTLQPPQIQ